MIDRQANAIQAVISDPRRRRTVERRRRSKRVQYAAQWVVARSRKRTLKTVAVCTGVLLLMAIGLYLGLSRQDSARETEGATKFSPIGLSGVA